MRKYLALKTCPPFDREILNESSVNSENFCEGDVWGAATALLEAQHLSCAESDGKLGGRNKSYNWESTNLLSFRTFELC